ncbi:MAG: hypothetical protein MUO42_05380 [Anaerolineaceae bacterium]|nr:hypothetical protein [Anaerolineaceae bacterium]
MIIAIGFLFAAIIDFIHALTYKGMPFFNGFTANLPSQLWIAARYLQALTFVIATIYINQKTTVWLEMGVYSVVTSALIISIFKVYFPDCYIEGVGVSNFIIISEYIIASLF